MKARPAPIKIERKRKEPIRVSKDDMKAVRKKVGERLKLAQRPRPCGPRLLDAQERRLIELSLASGLTCRDISNRAGINVNLVQAYKKELAGV